MTAVGGLARYRFVAVGAGLLLLAGAVSGCGGSSDKAATDTEDSVVETDATTSAVEFTTTDGRAGRLGDHRLHAARGWAAGCVRGSAHGSR